MEVRHQVARDTVKTPHTQTGGAPNMCITIVKRSNFERPYLDKFWVTNEKLNGFELGHGAPIDCRRVLCAEYRSLIDRTPQFSVRNLAQKTNTGTTQQTHTAHYRFTQ